MKKALAILMVLALVASAATAEITFGAWGRGLFIPVMNSGADDDDTTQVNESKATATTGISWGTPNPRIGMTIKGVSENAGFQIDWNSDGASFGISDQNKIWIKPVSMVTVSIGRVFDDTLRGNACFGAWDWYRAYSVVGTVGSEDFVFQRIDTLNQGFVVSVAPIDGLYFVASFNDLGNYQRTEYLLGDFQFQAGYTIANIGQIRAGYKSVQQDALEATTLPTVKAARDAEVAGTIEVAFKLTAIENLYADFGVRMTTNDEVQDKYSQINLYASYKMDAFKFHLIGQTTMYNDDKIVDADGDEINLGYMTGVGVDYALANGFSVMGDIRFMDKNTAYAAACSKVRGKIRANAAYVPTAAENAAVKDTDKTVLSYFAGINKDFSNGNIGAGVEVMTGKDTSFAIPIRVGYSF